MPIQSRLKCDLEKLRNPDVAGTFQATIGGKFAPLINLRDGGINTDFINTTFSTAVTHKVSEILAKEWRRKIPL